MSNSDANTTTAWKKTSNILTIALLIFGSYELGLGRGRYEKQVSDYAATRVQYDRIQAQYSALQKEYDVLLVQQESLQKQYAALQEQYDRFEAQRQKSSPNK
jgi:chromosome segregation ATPase